MKRITIFLTFIFSIALLFNACEKMEDIHSQYLEDGDIIYAPKPLIIQTFAGQKRVGLKYYLMNAVNVNKCIVEWNDGEESQTIDIAPNVPVDSVEFMINNLEEKSYIFKIYTIDSNGNRSIKEQVTGSSYDAKYISGLTNRSIVSIVGGGTIDSVTIAWGTPAKGNTGTEISYNNVEGQPVSKMVMPDELLTVIKGWESEGTLTYKSFYIPEENAIDTFATELESTMLPAFIEFEGVKISNEKWEIVDFSTEEPGEGAPNGLASAAIDGNLGTFWHTQWSGGSPGYPHFITVDLIDIVKINRMDFFRRQGDARGQTRFQIETSLDGVNYTNQGSFDYDPKSDSQSYQLGNLPMARYIKYTAIAGSKLLCFLVRNGCVRTGSI
jgi:hypothetical protein